MSVTTRPLASFSAKLPLELFMIVKESIPTSDLRTHVCFYNTCRKFASFYGDAAEQAEFWRRSCLLCGLTMLGHDTSYKDLAFDCIVKDGFCPHPQCGGNLLEWNAEQVEKAMELGWDPENEPWQETEDNDDPEFDPSFPTPIPNRIFAHIAFRKTGPLLGCPRLEDAFLRSEKFHVPMEKLLLRNHPIAVRSLATFPAVNKMVLKYPGSSFSGSYVSFPTPVLVLGVISFISAELDEELRTLDLLALLEEAFVLVKPTEPVHFSERLAMFSSLRGLWAVSRWDGLEYDGTWDPENGPGLVHGFSALPDEILTRELHDEDIHDRIEGSDHLLLFS